MVTFPPFLLDKDRIAAVLQQATNRKIFTLYVNPPLVCKNSVSRMVQGTFLSIFNLIVNNDNFPNWCINSWMSDTTII